MITFKIVTPYGVTYEDSIEKVTIPTTDGDITVLESHIPLVTTLKPGVVTVYKDGGNIELAISTGIVEVRPESEVYVMADTSERAEHIDIERAEEAKRRAEELMAQKDQDADIDFARLQAVIDRELVRVSLGTKWRNLK